ncbi:ABC transporter permease [Anaerotruncus colihominis]|uniref:ABC transporter permease n=1 Tax=Anaerotruncus colihominis TaxID=169435 RepID=UPI00267325E7|nr:ABC transporter permease [Anaerotruncus colihominis]
MKISDMISMCFGNLFRRKMRTILTVIGVVVGTCAIVVMISLGLGMNQQLENTLAQMGSRLTTIDVMNYRYSGMSDGDNAVMDDAAVEKIQNLPGVEVATPIYSPNLQARIYAGKDDRYQMQLYDVTGMYAEAMPKMGYTLLEGEYPAGPQTDKKKPIYVVVGEYAGFSFEDTKKKFDNYRWPEMDENGELKQEPFVDIMNDELILRSDKQDEDDPDSKQFSREIKPIGRVKEDYDKGWVTSQGIIMDIEDVKWLEKEYNRVNKITTSSRDKKGYTNVTVKVETMEDVESVQAAIEAMGFDTNSMEDVRKPMQEQARQQQIFLGGLGGISLLVAAIGITNTMIMSIYERTREIGVMKVLGCKVKNIRSVFLMEAGVIGFFGGCIGVAVSYGISYLMNVFNFSFSGSSGGMGGGMSYGMGYMMGGGMDAGGASVSVIPPWLVVAAIAFATLIGLISGVLPANRAMKISALEAIKHE